ncbi:hypothetical protein LJC33_00560 [Eubacteriales bacterium OttesenSCG-928-N13]|nr:hypothetical protein [Eubacteriales bacterium OttesenSCG-928-N13]
MTIDTLSNKIRSLATLKAEKRRLAEQTKDVGAQIEEQEREITSAMLDMAETAGLSCVDDFAVTVDGRRYSTVTKPYYSIPAEQRDQAFRALKELGLGDLVVERVDDRALTKVLMELSESAGGELPDEYGAIPVRFYEKMTISDRKVG